MEDFGSFYRSAFRGERARQWILGLTANAPEDLYHTTNAEDFFIDAWRGYKRNFCTPEQLDSRSEKLVRQAMLANDQPVPTKQEVRALMASREPQMFDGYRDTYFMLDLYPENADRFDVSYARVEGA